MKNMRGYTMSDLKYYEAGWEPTKSNAVIEYIPTFVEGYEPRMAEFDTIAELLEIDWIKERSFSPSYDFIEYEIKDKLISKKIKLHNKDKIEKWVIGKLYRPIEGEKTDE